eukprot:8297984-Pyramimonas_sp.AAC.1
MADLDCQHVKTRRAREGRAVLSVMPPPVVVPPIVSRADVALAALRRDGHPSHQAFPIHLGNGATGMVCAVCGVGGVALSASFRAQCNLRPSAWGVRVLRGLALGRYLQGSTWVPLAEPWRPDLLVASGQALRPP